MQIAMQITRILKIYTSYYATIQSKTIQDEL